MAELEAEREEREAKRAAEFKAWGEARQKREAERRAAEERGRLRLLAETQRHLVILYKERRREAERVYLEEFEFTFLETVREREERLYGKQGHTKDGTNAKPKCVKRWQTLDTQHRP